MEKTNEDKNPLDAIQLNNTYTYRRPNFIRWKGSVIPHVLPSTIVVTLITVVVCILHLHAEIKLSIPLSFVTVLSFVVGLLLTYRTNTAYDRYWEGRRLWSTVVLAVRTLTRIIWVNIKEEGTDDILKKKTAINLLLGFAVATKHYLREEEGSQYDDLKPLISNIKSNLPGFEPLDDQDLTEQIVKASKLKFGKTLSIRLFKSSVKPHKRRKGTPSPVNHNLPLEISLYLSSYIDDQSQKKNADGPTTTAMYNSLNVLIDCLTHFERILRSPIPLAYSIHLSHTVWIYCLSLPFQLVEITKYVTIPIVFIATFVLMGIMQIGEEIENPFGYDANDLDLDDFCEHIRRELDTITARKRPTIKDWVFTEENHPFGPEEISAAEARKLSLDEVRSLLTIASENRTSVDKTRETIKEDEPPIDNVAVKMD